MDVPASVDEILDMTWEAQPPSAFEHRQTEALTRCKTVLVAYYLKPMRELTERLCRRNLQHQQGRIHMFVKLANLVVRSSLRQVKYFTRIDRSFEEHFVKNDGSRRVLDLYSITYVKVVCHVFIAGVCYGYSSCCIP